jgi:hypothetical protein
MASIYRRLLADLRQPYFVGRNITLLFRLLISLSIGIFMQKMGGGDRDALSSGGPSLSKSRGVPAANAALLTPAYTWRAEAACAGA